ncbi:phosphate/phosphite/phosphonate ABC transporter substrate-binding protein [Halorussus limi]|uniref:Phosphate/phosphite/phosphonate ABC transporter substrate-binding protein n=1 Tax=Halorussus limi TaxID=2938695 RepID=A0A8U0HXK5_9EURY|nr:phosphate/phosphite/phosphonate ABC transporter substrate-binding protein [Halorussus limi]UPV75461.1 phosphate/phosphite/phosphonate ABC transporter substrate-binding protein [Halorussus limi]
MENRRRFLKTAATAGAVGITGTAGCIGNLSGSGGSQEVRFILTPAESSVSVKKQYQGVFDYIEQETGVKIKAKKAGDYAAVYQALKSDQADIADASPTLGVVGTDEGVADILGIRVAYGAAKYFSLITTKPDNDINKLTDLKGETVAFADKLSTSGSLFPLYMLKQAGLDIGGAPEGNPKDFTGKWSGHDQAFKAMKNRDDVAAAGTGAFVSMPHVPKDQFPDRVKNIAAGFDDAGSKKPEMQLLKASQPIPRAPILMRSNWDSDKREDIKTALLEAEAKDLKNDNSAEDLWFTGLKKGDASDYKPVKNVKNALGLEFGSDS